MVNDITGRRPEVTDRITRGVLRYLYSAGYAAIAELPLVNGRRVDVMGVNDKGEIVIVEVKSSREDFQADSKWQDYLPSCDRFYFAVEAGFPVEILPEETGLIIADAHGADILRPAGLEKMHATARKAVMVRFARKAAAKWWALQQDMPDVQQPGGGRVF